MYRWLAWENVNWCLIFYGKFNVKHDVHSFFSKSAHYKWLFKVLSTFTVPDSAEESFVNLTSTSKNHPISVFLSSVAQHHPVSEEINVYREWRNECVPPDNFRQMPMARHYTTEVKGFRSNPSERSCLEKGHTEDIFKPTLTASQLRVRLQIYKWSAWLQQHTYTLCSKT